MRAVEFNEDWVVRDEAGRSKSVVLPHDAMIEREREPESKAGGAQAYFPGGRYCYEKKFWVPEEWAEQSVYLQFEGVYKNARVYLNGKEAGGASYGYIPFFVNTEGMLHYGAENVVRVEAENEEQPDSRWYTGAGIYRPVWLWMGRKEHIEPEGVKITTLSCSPARILVQADYTGEGCGVRVEILEEKRIAEGEKRIVKGEKIIAEAEGNRVEIEVPDAKLWSDETPFLYRYRVSLVNNGVICDTAEGSFGIRKVTWDENGLYVNGKNTLLRGGCIHHDNGILGAAAHDKSEERRVRLLKEAGYNAVRSAHNPASRALLEACDRFGMYVMDESWDMWFAHKSRFDYACEWRQHYREDLKAMVARDYNHPSVILYSIGNEVSEPAKEEGVRLTGEMVDYLHELDPGRAVTIGLNLMIVHSSKKGKGIYKEEGGRDESGDEKMSKMNSTMFNMVASMVGTGMNKSANSKAADESTAPCLDLVDIAGYNYASGRYPLEGKAHPGRLVVGSETFPQDIARNWAMVKKYPYLIGDFMWTAWDYLGEVGIGAWAYTEDGKGFSKPYPWLLADCGAFDILGNPGAAVACARAAWDLDEAPYIGVQPVNHPGVKPAKAVWRGTNAFASWSYQGCEGNLAVIEVYSSAPVVELSLNGKSLGRKKTKLCRAVFKTKYRSGRLEAAAYDRQGKNVGSSSLISAEGKIKIQALPEEKEIGVGEICYIPVTLAGENGVVESNADRELTATVEGGELLAFGSANPRTRERYDSGSFATYYGRALAVVRGTKKGALKLKVNGEGMETAEAVVEVV